MILRNCCRSIGFYSLLTIACLLCVVACKTTQSVSGSPKETTTVQAEIKITEPLVFKTLNSKIAIEYQGFGLSGQLRIKYDSVLWVSLSKFGFEVARVKATPDSVFFLNKIENEHFAGDYSFIKKQLGFDLNYNFLQALLIGNDFTCYSNKYADITKAHDIITIEYKNRSADKDCSSNKSLPTISQVLMVSAENSRIVKNTVRVAVRPETLTAEYSSFSALEKQLIATDLKLSIETSSSKMGASMNFSNIELNKQLSFPFSIPAKSTPINL